MDTKPNWKELKSWQFWVFTIVVNGILSGIWLGFDRLYKMIPLMRDIGLLVILVAGTFIVAWYLSKSSIQYATAKGKFDFVPTHKRLVQLEHNGVLWEDTGLSSYGDVNVDGPLCPKDLTPLCIKRYNKVESSIDYDTYISKDGYQLYCIECESRYLLSKEPKKIADSMDEVRRRFEGIRNRERETK